MRKPYAYQGNYVHRDNLRPGEAVHDGQAEGGDRLADEMASHREIGADVLCAC